MKTTIAIILTAILLACFVTATAEVYEIDGDVLSVNSDTAEVIVIADDGQIYAFYGDGFNGRVHLLLIDDAVVDAISYEALSTPFMN